MKTADTQWQEGCVQAGDQPEWEFEQWGHGGRECREALSKLQCIYLEGN